MRKDKIIEKSQLNEFEGIPIPSKNKFHIKIIINKIKKGLPLIMRRINREIKEEK